jgi:nicotinate-nucleotide pyrophosphorylase
LSNYSVEWHVKEGEVLKPIQTCAHVYGPVRQILIGERTALNMMARCSGIASQAHRLRILKEKNGFKGVIAGTRKTTPGTFPIPFDSHTAFHFLFRGPGTFFRVLKNEKMTQP